MAVVHRSPQIVFGERADPSNPGNKATTAVSVAGTTVTYSAVHMPTGQIEQVTLHVAIPSGTPNGTISVQQTNDPQLASLGEVTGQFASAQTQRCRWAEIASAAVAAGVIAGAPPGSPNDLMVSIQNGSFATRLVYSNSSGSGTIVAWAHGVGN